MHSKLSNVVTNPLRSKDEWSGNGQHWGTPGLQLVARAHDNDSAYFRPEAYVRTDRDDIMYGSFRALMKNVHAPGTFVTFNWASSDRNTTEGAQAIGFMIPAAETSTVTFWSGSRENMDSCSANKTAFVDVHEHVIAGDDSHMHEYRFDWMPNRMDFYIDGHLLSSSADVQPLTGGAIELQLWSSGAARYAPALEAEPVITIQYAKLYFNTTASSSKVSRKWDDGTCQGWDLKEHTEVIPSEFFDEANSGKTFFFSKPETHDQEALNHTDSDLHLKSPALSSDGNQQHCSLMLGAVMALLIGFAGSMA